MFISYRAASVKNNEESADAPEVQAEGSVEGGTPGSGEGCEGSAWSPHALSPGSGRDDDQDDAPPDREGFDLVPVREETTSGNSYLRIYASSTREQATCVNGNCHPSSMQVASTIFDFMIVMDINVEGRVERVRSLMSYLV